MPRDYVLQPFRAPIHLQIDYARLLNEQQHAAVTAPPGPSLVIAGAGSGKTRTLTYRVAFLLEQGVPPERILLLTFTNKAAKEMMHRVCDLLGAELSTLWGGTFHSIGARLLRKQAELIGYQPDFSIMDREDAKDLLRTCLGEMGLDLKALHFPKPDVLADIFSLAVNTEQSLADLMKDEFDYFAEIEPHVRELQKRYADRKRATNAMDFDDLLALWLKLLKEQPEVREQYQRRFQFVLVDEYQDTNKIQGDLIDLLAARHHNVMAVGDDSQSIYSWRGAHFLNILKFPDRYPGAKVYRIETNYRSTPEILSLANAAIAPNRNQFEKRLIPARPPGAKPALVPCADGAQQAAFVAQHAQRLCEEGVPLNKIAVLYRSHFHALELQLELTRRGIPFSITSGIRFFEQAHLKDVAAYLRWVSNPRDELAFKRIVRMLPGVGAVAANKLWNAFNAGLPSAGQEALSRAAAMQKCSAAVPKKTATDWAQLIATISQLENEPARGNASAMIELVLEAGYEEHLQEEYANYRSRLEDLGQLAAYARQFETVDEFLSQLALQTSIEAEAEEKPKPDDEALRLSTVHQAKGLEFDVVFIIMLCDGLFPSSRSIKHPDDEEEERRLFYVAITRARDELYLTYPLLRLGPGASDDAMQRPSRFLDEIPRDLLEEWNLQSFSPYG